MKKTSLSLLACSCLFSLSTQAATITVNTGAGGIYNVDTVTGNSLQVASGTQLTDIARDSSGNLWGISFNNFYNIDTNAGTVNFVGALGAGAGNMNALTFDSSGNLFASSAGTSFLYSVDTGTGSATEIGSGQWASSGDLAYDASGNLFLSAQTGVTDSLARVDPSNGVALLVGDMGVNDVFGLAFTDGTMFGTAGTNLYSLDTFSGVSSFVTGINGLNGAVWGATSAVPIPAAVWLFMSALGLLGFAQRKRRSVVASGSDPIPA